MALKNTAVFAQTPKTGSVVVTAAAAGLNTDSPTNTALLMAAGPDGAVVTRVGMTPRGTVTAHCAYLFVRRAAQPVNERTMYTAAQVPAKTADASNPPDTFLLAAGVSEQTPLRLGAGDELYVALSIAQSVGVAFFAEYTDF